MKCKYCGIEVSNNATVCSECGYAANIASLNEKRHNSKCDVLTIRNLLRQNECTYCHYILNFSQKHIDHIIPISRGGTNASDNLCLTCSYCNLQKHDKTGEEYQQYLDEHPEEFRSREARIVRKLLGKRRVLEITPNGPKVVEKNVYDELIKGNNILEHEEPPAAALYNSVKNEKIIDSSTNNVISVYTEVKVLKQRQKNIDELYSDKTIKKEGLNTIYSKNKESYIAHVDDKFKYIKTFYNKCNITIPKIIDKYSVNQDSSITIWGKTSENEYSITIGGSSKMLKQLLKDIRENRLSGALELHSD